MKIRRHSKAYNFLGDTKTGLTFRWGKTLKEDPPFAPWPELADISISNHCTKGCDYCYRDSKNNSSFMSLDNYEYLLNELQHSKWGNIFQIAIGGGEPLEHPQLKQIIEATISRNIVPNLTTNGFHLDGEYASYFKGRIGAVALSVTDIKALDLDKIKILLKESVRINIHYVLSNRNISQAVDILKGKYNKILHGLNSVIFLTHKPHGRGSMTDILKINANLKNFIKQIDHIMCSARIGFDACFVPLLLHFTKTDSTYIDSCEGGFFSIYIDESLNIKPCSFDNNGSYTFNLREYSFSDIWEYKLDRYRAEVVNHCKRECSNKTECRGACYFYNEITCCFSEIEEEALYV